MQWRSQVLAPGGAVSTYKRPTYQNKEFQLNTLHLLHTYLFSYFKEKYWNTQKVEKQYYVLFSNNYSILYSLYTYSV